MSKKERATRRPRILVLGCGGTIAMVPGPKGLEPKSDVKDLLKMVPTLHEHAALVPKQLMNLDSSDLNPSHWTKIAMEIAEAVASQEFDAILVTHGTDTMPHTATAVAIVLGNKLDIPIVFTGSQLELVKFGTDARFNLENSLNVLLEAIKLRIAEVMLVFNDVVIRATRSKKASESAFRAMESPAFPPLARISAIGVSFIPEARRGPKNGKLGIKDCHFHFDPNVVVLDLVPGFQPGILFDIIKGGKCKALVLRSLGAGNVPSLDEYSLIPCIRAATDLEIPVVITTKFVGGTTHAGIYRPGRAALEAGAIESRDLTDEAVHVKVAWLLARGYRSATIQKALLSPVAGEVTR